MPEIVDCGVAQGQQQGVDILFAKEMLFAKVVFSGQNFVEEYSFLPEIVDCEVAQGPFSLGLPKASRREEGVDILLAKETMFAKVVFSFRDFVEEYSFLPEIVDCGVAQGE